jgi:hypothetical protein
MLRAERIHARTEQTADTPTGYVVGANNALISLAPGPDFPPAELPGPVPTTDATSNISELSRVTSNGEHPYAVPIPVVPYEPTIPLTRPSRDPDAAWMAPTESSCNNDGLQHFGSAAWAVPVPASASPPDVYPRPAARDHPRHVRKARPPTWAELIRRRIRRERERRAAR